MFETPINDTLMIQTLIIFLMFLVKSADQQIVQAFLHNISDKYQSEHLLVWHYGISFFGVL